MKSKGTRLRFYRRNSEHQNRGGRLKLMRSWPNPCECCNLRPSNSYLPSYLFHSSLTSSSVQNDLPIQSCPRPWGHQRNRPRSRRKDDPKWLSRNRCRKTTREARWVRTKVWKRQGLISQIRYHKPCRNSLLYERVRQVNTPHMTILTTSFQSHKSSPKTRLYISQLWNPTKDWLHEARINRLKCSRRRINNKLPLPHPPHRGLPPLPTSTIVPH